MPYIVHLHPIGRLGAIFILRKDIGVGGPENGNFLLLYVVKISLRRWVGGLKTPLHNIKMAPNIYFCVEIDYLFLGPNFR